MRLFVLTLLLISAKLSFANQINIVYTSPVNNAKYVRHEENIILSANEFINESSLSVKNLINVSGNIRGDYPGNIVLSTDGKTMIFNPDNDFLPSEYITVSVNNGIMTTNGNTINPVTFSFIIRDTSPQIDTYEYFLNNFSVSKTNPNFVYHQRDTLPENLPTISILNSSNPSYGRFFFSNFGLSDYQGGGGGHGTGNENRITGNSPVPHLLIMDNNGDPYYYKRVTYYGLDFKMVSDNQIVFFEERKGKYHMMDTNFIITDSFSCGNGYPTDHHELIFNDEGHALLMSYDPVRIDMSQIVANGNTRASVTGLVIQELDKNKNVIFQWRSWDHVQITDATREDLTLPKIDYIHGNSIEPDLDGNLIISSRHFDEVTKINRVTGEIMWRLGGKNNEFTFLNDTIPFTHQHDARRVAPGRITIFDNGNFRNGFPYSRVVEYELDEVNKTATLVWEFDHNKEIFGFAMGNAQRLPNGNTVIGWGTGYPSITEVDQNGNIVFEMAMPDSLWTYRAFKFTINQPDAPIPDNYSLSQNYPNPFNPNTNISFTVPLQGIVTLKIYDILGREVAQLVNEDLNPGNYNILWNAGKFSSGVYFYTLTGDNFIETKKMVLIR